MDAPLQPTPKGTRLTNAVSSPSVRINPSDSRRLRDALSATSPKRMSPAAQSLKDVHRSFENGDINAEEKGRLKDSILSTFSTE